MTNSMTGFSRREVKLTWGSISWEIRSVNHRYLEPHFRLPDIVREQEPALRDHLRKCLSRGKIEAIFNYETGQPDARQQLTINSELVEELSNVIDTVAGHLSNAAPVNPLQVLNWPGVMRSSKIDQEELLQQSLLLFQQTLESLIHHRQREGAELSSLIQQRLDLVSEQVALVRSHMPTILSNQRRRLLEKLDSLRVELDQSRLEQELVYLAQKTDVDEELDRLDTHVLEVHRTLKQKGSIGRRLDFLMQELNREANTLSSKSVVTETTQAAIELKVLIEQMREQIQNIE